MRSSIVAATGFAALVSVLAPPRSAGAAGPAVQLTQVGTPIWRPTDFHLFSTAAAPFPGVFQATAYSLAPLDGLSGQPRVSHGPPYDGELAAGMASNFLVDATHFVADDISLAPDAVYFIFEIVPDPGVVGQTRDFASGPMIPNSVAPIAHDIDMWLDGARVDRMLGADGDTNGDLAFAGFSHVPIIHVAWYPWDDDPQAGPNGSYEIRESLRDVDANGWDMVVPFVVPEPSPAAIAGAAILATLGLAARRRGMPHRT